jgi:ubiquinone/menaquinone biosynthesis C-methylase UbiE
MRFTPRTARSDAIAFHDRLATRWESKYAGARFLERLNTLCELLPQQQTGKRWLDAGCGTGTIARWLAKERGAMVTAIDASRQMLANTLPFPGVTYIHADVKYTGLPNKVFDGIVCSSVLEYLEHPRTTLEEYARLLKSGGVLVVSVPHAAPAVRIPLKLMYWLTLALGKYRLYEFLDYSRHSFTFASLSRLLSSVGFTSIHVVDFGTLRRPFGVRLPFPGALLMARAVKL